MDLHFFRRGEQSKRPVQSRLLCKPPIPKAIGELPSLCASLRLCQDTLLTFESLSGVMHALLNPSREYSRDLRQATLIGRVEREIVLEVLGQIRSKDKTDPLKVEGRNLRCNFAQNFLTVAENHQRKMRWLCISNEKIEKILGRYLGWAVRKLRLSQDKKTDRIIDSWLEREAQNNETKKPTIHRVPRSEVDHYLYEAIRKRMDYCPSSKGFSEILGDRLEKRIAEKDPDEQSVNRLCRMKLLCLAFDTVSLSPWAKENFAFTLKRLWDEATLVLRRADVTSEHKKGWEAFLERRMELYADLIRKTTFALSENPDSPMMPESLPATVEEVYRGNMNPLALRRNFQLLGAALSSVIEDYRQFAKSDKSYFGDLEASLRASRALWNKANFSYGLGIVVWHDELLGKIRSRDLTDADEVKEFEVALRTSIHGIFSYLTRIHDVIFTWFDDQASAKVEFPAISAEADVENVIRQEFKDFAEVAKEITTHKHGYVLEFSPDIPVRDGLLERVCSVQNARLINHDFVGKQVGFHTPVSMEELISHLTHDLASLFTVHRPNGHVIGAFLIEKKESWFSDYGRAAVEASSHIEDLKGCELMFLEVVATLKGELIKFTEDGETNLPFDLIHQALETSCANDGDLLKDKVVLAWVREDNDVFEKYRRRGWTITDETREFSDKDPSTGEPVANQYKLIHFRVRTVDAAIRTLFARSGLAEARLGETDSGLEASLSVRGHNSI